MFKYWVRTGFIFLVLATLQTFGLAECKIQVSAVDGEKNAVADVQFRLVNHRSFSEVKKTGKTTAPTSFVFTEGLPYTIWAKKKGFYTSVVELARNCPNSSLDVAVLMLPGEQSRNIFIAGPNQTRDTSGNPYFGIDDVYAIGESWPRPSYGSGCSTDCEVIVNLNVAVDGHVASLQTVSGNPKLRNAVEVAMKQAKFKPVYLGGTFIPITATMRFTFK